MCFLISSFHFRASGDGEKQLQAKTGISALQSFQLLSLFYPPSLVIFSFTSLFETSSETLIPEGEKDVSRLTIGLLIFNSCCLDSFIQELFYFQELLAKISTLQCKKKNNDLQTAISLNPTDGCLSVFTAGTPT